MENLITTHIEGVSISKSKMDESYFTERVTVKSRCGKKSLVVPPKRLKWIQWLSIFLTSNGLVA